MFAFYELTDDPTSLSHYGQMGGSLPMVCLIHVPATRQTLFNKSELLPVDGHRAVIARAGSKDNRTARPVCMFLFYEARF